MQIINKAVDKAPRTPQGNSNRTGEPTAGRDAPHPLLLLQQKIGNRAAGRLIQAKPKVSQPGDPYEQEADRVADQVIRMPEPVLTSRKPGGSLSGELHIQRACTGCDEEMERKAEDEERDKFGSTDEAHLRIDALRSGGQPLPGRVRAFFEPRFGYDLSQVRVHIDAQAAESAQAVNARAYTVGYNVVFGQGEYQPDTSMGQRLLAHELVHVVQQGYGGDFIPSTSQAQARTGPAEVASTGYVQSQNSLLIKGGNPLTLARQTSEEVLGLQETARIEGEPARHPTYIENMVRAVGILGWGGPFRLYRRIENGVGVDDVLLARAEVHLTDDPLSRLSVSFNRVYLTREAANRAVSASRIQGLYTFYLGPGGMIYPTIISQTTAPALIATLRRESEDERAAARQAERTSVDLLLWYVGLRIPLRAREPAPPRALAGAAAAGEIVGPLGRLTAAEIQQAITASGGRTIEVYTKLTQAPQAGRAVSFTTERVLAEAARAEGRIFAARIPDVLLFRLESIGVIIRSTTLMGGVTATELRVLPQAAELIIRFLIP